jgi:hypothetical protein
MGDIRTCGGGGGWRLTGPPGCGKLDIMQGIGEAPIQVPHDRRAPEGEILSPCGAGSGDVQYIPVNRNRAGVGDRRFSHHFRPAGQNRLQLSLFRGADPVGERTENPIDRFKRHLTST